MKMYLVIDEDRSKVYGAGSTSDEARDDAIKWTEGDLSHTVTIPAEVNVSSVDEVSADTRWTEIKQ